MSHNLASIYRSHTCKELSKKNVGDDVLLSGWIHRKRDHGGILFIDLRDHYGITQIVSSSDSENEVDRLLKTAKIESVISVKGKVVKRDDSLVNSSLATGEIEVKASEASLLCGATTLPFQIADDDNAPEHIRLKYRFLDLRRKDVHDSIVLRSKVISFIRNKMIELGFLEHHTPILTSSSPEGARDFLVPSRIHPGKFFALPQAPQIFKQLLMVSGFDRYFQIAPCFRDEDPRADRSPGEFYQLDLEMSFVEQEDVFKVAEQVFTELFQKYSDQPVSSAPFPRLTYREAIERFGSDKPDLRNPLELSKVTEIFKNTEFKVFAKQIEKSGDIVSLPIYLDEVPTRKFLDDSVKKFTQISGAGIGYLIFEKDGDFKGSISKFISQDEAKQLRKSLQIDESDKKFTLVYLAAGKPGKIHKYLGRFRNEMGELLNLIDVSAGFKFCWITDMAFYEEDDDSGKIDFSHNPFSMPQGGLDALNNKNPLEINASQYDLVCNGYELVSGAIRNHLPEIMYKAFDIVGYSKEEVDEQFGAMIRAFAFGTPPHGGMAAGIERIVMLLAGKSVIRDVIPFPLAQTCEDLMMGAPSLPTEQQLADLGIAVVKEDEEE